MEAWGITSRRLHGDLQPRVSASHSGGILKLLRSKTNMILSAARTPTSPDGLFRCGPVWPSVAGRARKGPYMYVQYY